MRKRIYMDILLIDASLEDIHNKKQFTQKGHRNIMSINKDRFDFRNFDVRLFGYFLH